MNKSAETATTYALESGGQISNQELSSFGDSELRSADARTYWSEANKNKRENQRDLPQITIEDFVENSERLMKKIDLDKDRRVSEQEMSIAVDNPYINGKDAQTLAAIYRISDYTENIHQETFNPFRQIETDRIGKDLQTLLDLGSRAHAKDGPLNVISMTDVDQNNDSLIDRGELARARKSDSGVELVALTKFFYKEEQRAVREGKAFAGIADEQLEQFNRVIGVANINAPRIADHAIKRTAEVQRNSVSTEVFADKNNPLESISADAIHQGALGNCYLQAALAGVATQKPELIRDMIQDVGHGVYKVTFPGDKENPVYVNAPSDLNIGIFNKGGAHGTWPNILEKAYGRHKQQQNGTMETTRGDAKGTDGGGQPKDLIALLTGSEAERQAINSSLVEMNKDNPKYIERNIKGIVDALNDGRVVTTATGKVDDSNNFGVPEYHALTVINSFERDGKTYLSVRDPWNSDSRSRNNEKGVFELEALEFLRAFDSFSYELPKQTQ